MPARQTTKTTPSRKRATAASAEPKPVKHFRIPPVIWDPFVAKCEREGYGVSERVRQLMREDVANG